jgi:nitrite reductase (NADH) small subunit
MSISKEATLVWVEAVAYEELSSHTGRTIRYGAEEVALFKLSTGTVHAIQNRCPHKNGVLAEGIVCDEHVFCPMHDRRIHLPSGEVQKPDTGCVRTYSTKVENGRVFIAFLASEELAG